MLLKEKILSFDGLKSFLPGFQILSYSWDFGDKIKSKGEKVNHSYINQGEYIVNLELVLKSDSTGHMHRTGVSKKIVIFNDVQEIALF